MNQGLRFILAGLFNTGLTYGIYRLLILFLPYHAAYLIAFGCGIGLAYTLNARFVFQVPLSKKGFFYPLIYLIQYLLSACLLEVLVQFSALGETYAPLLVTVMMVPFSFVLNKAFLQGKQRSC